MRIRSRKLWIALAVAVAAVVCQPFINRADESQGALRSQPAHEVLPTGLDITPTAAEGSSFVTLNPDLPSLPDFVAGQAVTTAVSRGGNTLLILTSGYNQNNDSSGQVDPSTSNEYVFVYDISASPPTKLQVLQVPNAFNGLAWNPYVAEFYVSGGVDDVVHVFTKQGITWSESLPAISLGHTKGGVLGLVKPMTAGLGVTADAKHLIVANYENDSASIVDLKTRMVVAELELRPGKIDPHLSGVPGGEFPFWVAVKGSQKAYISSPRDREIVVLSLAPVPMVAGRIPVKGEPNKMILNKSNGLLYVALDNSDSVAVISTGTDKVIGQFKTAAPRGILADQKGLNGSNPNSLALSPDERTLFVTNGGANSLAVIKLSEDGTSAEVVGLIPTGWYPNSVSLNRVGSEIYVINGKSIPGPNPEGCRNTLSIAPGSLDKCSAANQYMWQLTKAGFLTLPMPSWGELQRLTRQVARNNHYRSAESGRDRAMMGFLHDKIKHVIYIVKENRTYDQVLGDLEKGNGDPSLALFPEASISPNHHQLARQFVTLDNFYDSGEVSGDGWNWTTSARTTDSTEKTVSVNYAGRGLTYDWEGTNRNINVGYATVAERQAANPLTPGDPDLLPGTADVSAPDGPEGEAGAGYLWDAALRAKIPVRNYGFFLDLARYSLPPSNPAYIPPIRDPFAEGTVVAFPTKAALQSITDPYFRGFDMKLPDFWRFKEWEREFDQFVENGDLPALEFVRFPHDHFGNFATAIDDVNTVETEFADNDYAVGLLVEKIAHSRYKNDTLIFVIEDDAQDGPDHVDAHRSIGYVIGPYVKQGEVVSKHYTTVSMLRTIEDILGLDPLGLNDGFTPPMSEVFGPNKARWTYSAILPTDLRSTGLPLVVTNARNSLLPTQKLLASLRLKRDSLYWDEKTRGFDFTVEDRLDSSRFNRILWAGLMGENRPYPAVRDGRDLRHDRKHLLESNRKDQAQ